jgi:hypothetical protein
MNSLEIATASNRAEAALAHIFAALDIADGALLSAHLRAAALHLQRQQILLGEHRMRAEMREVRGDVLSPLTIPPAPLDALVVCFP